ncbi:DNA/RNA non-specific endonuclease [Dactylosporangium sp. CA-139114]|uniref:DNA/RNA non-specific endonuclease n=1 Tax=Dactylosporangium sp. CA-139114 TaxID=3239931 RepID=UPI003D97184F
MTAGIVGREKDDYMGGAWGPQEIKYWDLDHSIADPRGRASGAEACYSGGVVKSKGSPARYTPPGFVSGVHDRGHLIAGTRLGGSGVDPRNITPVFTKVVNQSAQYHGVEKYVADRVASGDDVYYRVEPRYRPGAEVPYETDHVVASSSVGVVHIVVKNVP